MEPKKGSSLMRREMGEEFASLVGRQWQVGEVVVGGGQGGVRRHLVLKGTKSKRCKSGADIP